SSFKEGDYKRCVQHFFNVTIVDDSGKAEPVTPTPDPTPTPTPTPAPTDTNAAPVAVLTGPIGEVESQANVTLNASASSDANGDKLSYTWLLPNGTALEGTDRDSISFVAPTVTVKKSYTFNLTVSDGKKSNVASYTLTVTPQVQPLPDTGSGKTCANNWDAQKIYYGGESVVWKGKEYLANYWTQNNEPGNPEFTGEWSQWKEIKACK
ncbi:MAG: chitinase, partial [Serratia sp.]|nr:chitinase [Serratia sp. (in: enterobacteria)]